MISRRTRVAWLVGVLCLHSFGAERAAARSRVAVRAPIGAEELQQKMLDLSAAGGGVLLLPKNSTMTSTVHSITYKGRISPHALLVPEDVVLDLNDSTILLDLRSNSYGVRLASRATVRNGTIRLIRSEGSGSQRIWHAPVSVGAAYGDGGTPEAPSYFSRVVGWRMENLTIDQPFDKSAIQLMSEAANGMISDIRIADSASAPIGIGLDWGTVGPLDMKDERQKEMRLLFVEGRLYGTHPHDILIKKIRIGRLAGHRDDDDSVGIRTSGCYNITIEDLEVLQAGVGVAVHAGDAGFEYALQPHRGIGHAAYLIKNVKVHKALRKGIIIDGIADNVYRAIRNHGHQSLLSPVSPGIDQPLVRNAWLRGGEFVGESGVMVQFATGVKLEGIDAGEFQKGIHLRDWTKKVTVSQSRIHDNNTGVVVSGSERKPEEVLLTRNRFYRNGKDLQKSGGDVRESKNLYTE